MENTRNIAFHDHAWLFDALFSKPRMEGAQANNLAEILKAQLGTQDARILEVGCGGGRLCRYLSDQGFSVTGVDRSKEMIRLCQDKLVNNDNVKFICDDFLKGSFIGQWDGILFLYSFIQVLGDRDKEVDCLRRGKSILANGGIILIEVQNTDVNRSLYPPGRRHSFERDGFRVETLSTISDNDFTELSVKVFCSGSTESCEAEWSHKIKPMSVDYVANLVAQVGGRVVEVLDAPSMDRPFDQKTSQSALVIVIFD